MIIVRLIGGLGNQMFQYALGKHLAIKNNTVLKIDITYLLDRRPRKDMVYRDYDLPIFNIEEKIATKNEIAYFTGHYKSYWKRLEYTFLRRVNKANITKEELPHFESKVLQVTQPAYLIGFWQSEKYFLNIESIIRTDFTFKHRIAQKSIGLAQHIDSVNSVCLNVRRADYVTNPLSSKYLGFIGLAYIHRAVQVILEKVVQPEFFIFSDDIAWCEENIQLDYPYTVVSHEFAGSKFADYLQLMTLCKHFIIPNSTFAWWAAWLCQYADKVIVAPKNWVKENSRYNKDLIPDSWIQV
jgi:hypothetical protein